MCQDKYTKETVGCKKCTNLWCCKDNDRESDKEQTKQAKAAIRQMLDEEIEGKE